MAIDERFLNMVGDLELAENAAMVTSAVILIQYVDSEGRECRSTHVRSSEGMEGIRTWQMIGLLELAKQQVIIENLEGMDQ